MTDRPQVISEKLRGMIRNVVDFPKPGIVFRDITPLLANAEGLELACRAMAEPYVGQGVELVTGAESRGFIFGTVIARYLNCGFIPIRKPGKLPAATISQEYALEYGTDKLEMHSDALQPGQKVLFPSGKTTFNSAQPWYALWASSFCFKVGLSGRPISLHDPA